MNKRPSPFIDAKKYANISPKYANNKSNVNTYFHNKQLAL